MMPDKIIKLPISYSQRKANIKGEGYVPCEISGRYLLLEKISLVKDREFILIDVMTENSDKTQDRKLCQLIVNKNDLLKALNNAKQK